jgi:putative salt-induced outer membrane protein YdiY
MRVFLIRFATALALAGAVFSCSPAQKALRRSAKLEESGLSYEATLSALEALEAKRTNVNAAAEVKRLGTREVARQVAEFRTLNAAGETVGALDAYVRAKDLEDRANRAGVLLTGLIGLIGYRFIDREATSLLAEIGPGARRFQPIDALVGTPPVPTSFDAETNAIVRGSLDFKHQLTANTALTNLLLAESGSGSTFVQNDLGVAVQMSERFALKAGYQVRHTTEVPVGIEKTDTLFTTNLVVGF